MSSPIITRQQKNLHGTIRSVHSRCVPLSLIEGRLIEEDRENLEFEVYDPEGKLIEETSQERLMYQDPFKHVYNYSHGENIWVREEYDYAGPLESTTICCLNKKGLLTETTYSSSGEIQRQNISDKDGNILEYNHYGNGKIVSAYRSTFRKLGNNVEEISYEFNESQQIEGEVRYRSIRTYNTVGKEAEHVTYRPDDSLWAKWTTSFEQTGHTFEEFHYDENSSLTQSTTRKFDESGNIYEEECIKADGSLNYKLEFQYEFDATGNWIKQITNKWVLRWDQLFYEPVSVTHRMLSYY